MSARLAAGRALLPAQSGVGGADDPVPLPRDDEQHAERGLQDDPGRGVDPVLGHHEVDALGDPQVDRAPAADHGLDLVGPDPGRVDHLLGPDLQFRPGLQVHGPDAGHPRALPQETGHLDPGGDLRAVVGRGADQGEHVPRVVHLAVPERDRAGDRGPLEPGDQAQRAPAGQLVVPGQPLGQAERQAERVVGGDPGTDVGPLPHVMGEREEEGHRADQVRRDHAEQQRPLGRAPHGPGRR